MTPTATEPKLTASQARKLHDAEVRATQLKRQLEGAEAKRDELRALYRPRVPLSRDAEEAAKGVRATVVGGVTVRIFPQVSGETFSFKNYKLAGHPVTTEMRQHVSPGKPYDRWTVKRAAGPTKIGAVEPT